MNKIVQFPLVRMLTAVVFIGIVITWPASLPSLLLDLPFKPFQTAGAYGPLLAAVITSAALGRDELKSLFTRMTHFRFGFRGYLIAIFGIALLDLLVTGLCDAPLMQSLADNWFMIFTLYLPALFTSYHVNPIG